MPYLPPNPIRASADAARSASPAAARVLVAAFLTLLITVPAVHAVLGDSESPAAHVRRLFSREFTAAVPELERALAEGNPLRRAAAPAVQGLLCRARAGNSRVLMGPDGRLYWHQGAAYAVGRGVLDPLRTQRTPGLRRAADDPRACLLAFAEQLRRAGIRLVLLPVPEKLVLDAGHAAGRSPAEFDNRDTARLFAELRASGIEVYYPIDLPAPGGVYYERADSHWTPGRLNAVAADLSRHLRDRGLIAPVAAPPLRTVPTTAHGGVDLVRPLGLAGDDSLYPPVRFDLERVVTIDGRPWQPDESADILLMGDSFSAVYTEVGAGLPEQLSRHLGRPIAVAARPGAEPRYFHAELRRRPELLAGKRIVIWQFAVRQLTAEPWPVFELPALGSATGRGDRPESAVVVAELLTALPSFNPADTPYPDALAVLKFRVRRVESGSYEKAEALVVLPVMKDRKLLPAAAVGVGRSYRLVLSPEVPGSMRRWRRIDDTGEFDLPEMFAAEAIEVP